MSEPIKVGDLVMVKRSEAGHEGKIGVAEDSAPADIDNFDPLTGPRRWVRFPAPLKSRLGIYYNPMPFPESWLKRIPPLSELEGIKTEKEIAA